jgi:hypothetical protein
MLHLTELDTYMVNVLTRAHITQAVKRSNQEIEQVLSELESAGLIVYNRADDEVQIIV